MKDGIEGIHDLNEKMDYFVKVLADQTRAFAILVDTKADLEKYMSKTVCEYMEANKDVKKPSWDKLEAMSVKSPEQKEKYYHLVWLRSKTELATTVLESTKMGIMAIQSQMKFNAIPQNYKREETDAQHHY